MRVSEEAVLPDAVIWRYFKFDRFVNILKTHSLWFSRANRFDDQWEGLFPPSYARRTRQYAESNGILYEEFDRDFRVRLQTHRYGHFVNCWHMCEHESDAMWRLYALAKTGIAIKSTVGSVNECLQPHHSGRVIYYDPSNDVLSGSIFGPTDILFKRDVFSLEQEYRFWFCDDELIDRIEADKEFREEDLSPGKLVGISNMQRLVQKIVVAPGASDEFIATVHRACSD
jgi:hypothetical protein